MKTIVLLTPEHCSNVTELHLRYLQTNLTGNAARHLLEAYYSVVADASGAVGYVANENGCTVGFVCGIWNSTCLRRALLRRRWRTLLVWGIVSVLQRPRILHQFSDRLSCHNHPKASMQSGYELRPIVVVPESRASGVARMLLNKLQSDAKSRGYDRIHLITEYDNKAANAFYRKNGFLKTGEMVQYRQKYVQYEWKES